MKAKLTKQHAELLKRFKALKPTWSEMNTLSLYAVKVRNRARDEFMTALVLNDATHSINKARRLIQEAEAFVKAVENLEKDKMVEDDRKGRKFWPTQS